MRRRDLIGMVLALSALGAGCGSSSSSSSSSGTAGGADAAADPAFPASAITTVTSTGGKLKLAAFTAPQQPPVRGMVTMKLVVTDASTGDPVDGLEFAVEPVMTSMGHGTPVVPTTSPRGAGVYIVESLKLFMPGAWDLHLDMTGTVADGALVTLDVQ
jgi:hypothetical protein